jgi:hypothetical protein
VIRCGCVFERSRRKENVALDDRLGDVDQLSTVSLGMAAEQLEGLVGGDRMPRHEDALGLFDRRQMRPGGSGTR